MALSLDGRWFLLALSMMCGVLMSAPAYCSLSLMVNFYTPSSPFTISWMWNVSRCDPGTGYITDPGGGEVEAVAGSGLGRDRGKEKTSLWPHALELSGFLFPQWASVTQRSVWISFPALCVDPGLPRVVLV